MYLNATTAKEIIKEISPFIHYDLNIMDGNGLILASTKTNRIGTHHEGARILIDSQKPQLIVSNDQEYDGCKTGVNLPIYFAGQVIGVVGITGDPTETIKYGQMLQKMTEMIVYENFDASERALKENIDILYMNDLVHGNMESSLFNLEEWLLQSGIQCKGPFCVGIFSLIETQKNESLKPIRDTILKKDITKALKSKNILCASNGEYYIALSNHRPHHFAEIMNELDLSLQQNYQHSLLCTIGNEYADFLDISKSYNEALIIKRHFGNTGSGVYCFSNIVLDFVISQIPGIHKKNLYEQVFKDCTSEEICEYKEFIISYFECNGSLVQLAEKNFIHKNTVQYKINKIFRSTGHDLRKYNDLFILYLAARQ